MGDCKRLPSGKTCKQAGLPERLKCSECQNRGPESKFERSDNFYDASTSQTNVLIRPKVRT